MKFISPIFLIDENKQIKHTIYNSMCLFLNNLQTIKKKVLYVTCSNVFISVCLLFKKVQLFFTIINLKLIYQPFFILW